MKITDPRLWGAVLVGTIVVIGVVYLVRGDDGNLPATYEDREIVRVELCPGVDLTPAELADEMGGFRDRCWPGLIVTEVPDCSAPAPDGIHRMHRWGDWTLTTGPTEETEEDGGWTVEGETYIRSRYERGPMTVRHELGHIYGLGLRQQDGGDGHDQHASRLMARAPGSSWVGLDRCDGGDFEWRSR